MKCMIGWQRCSPKVIKVECKTPVLRSNIDYGIHVKWWWLVLTSTLVAALASFVHRQPDLYQARSALVVGQTKNNPNPTGNDFYLTEQLDQTYVNMANREPVRVASMATKVILILRQPLCLR